MTFREAADAAYHEMVAREHLEDGMPIVELHRNRGIPLSAVRKWIALYRSGGRAALDAAARGIAKNDAKPLSRKQCERLTAQLESTDSEVVRRAVIMIARRRAHMLADAVLAVVERRGSAAIEAVLTLGDLGATEHIDRANAILGPSYRGWIAGARERAKRV